MKNLRQALKRSTGASGEPRLPILWSEKKKEELRRIASRELPAIRAIDAEFALPLLCCADGNFTVAEATIIQVLTNNLDLCARDNEAFISALNALFAVQRLDLVAAMLIDRYGFDRPFRLRAQPNAAGVGQVV